MWGQNRIRISRVIAASPVTSHSVHLTTTFVEIEPGGKQRVHHHEPEQVYYIIAGTGKMTVGDEQEIVQSEDCIFIPFQEPHGLENIGDVPLKYFSAASPSFTEEELIKFWPLNSESNRK